MTFNPVYDQIYINKTYEIILLLNNSTESNFLLKLPEF